MQSLSSDEGIVRSPKLAQIVFIDFQELAVAGEEYLELCKRFSRKSLEPHAFSFSTDIELDFLSLLEATTVTPRACTWNASLGGHPYESFRQFLITAGFVPRHTYYRWDPSAFPCNLLIPKHGNLEQRV